MRRLVVLGALLLTVGLVARALALPGSAIDSEEFNVPNQLDLRAVTHADQGGQVIYTATVENSGSISPLTLGWSIFWVLDTNGDGAEDRCIRVDPILPIPGQPLPTIGLVFVGECLPGLPTLLNPLPVGIATRTGNTYTVSVDQSLLGLPPGATSYRYYVASLQCLLPACLISTQIFDYVPDRLGSAVQWITHCLGLTCPTATATATATASATPTGSPTASPSGSPTASPTASPSGSPTASPSGSPTASPSGSPTASPSGSPTASPTASPTGLASPIVVLFDSDGNQTTEFFAGESGVALGVNMIANRRYDLLFAQSPDELIGGATSSDDGILISPFVIPSTARLGAARITVDPLGEGQTVVLPITIIARTSATATTTPRSTSSLPSSLLGTSGGTDGTPKLPNTGSGIYRYIGLSGMFLLVGAALMALGRALRGRPVLAPAMPLRWIPRNDLIFGQEGGPTFYSGG